MATNDRLRIARINTRRTKRHMLGEVPDTLTIYPADTKSLTEISREVETWVGRWKSAHPHVHDVTMHLDTSNGRAFIYTMSPTNKNRETR